MARRWVLVAAISAAGIAACGRPPVAPTQSRAAAANPGLVVETVTAVYQDHAGFLWIGSRGGLILFDGHGSVTFEHDPADPLSISDNGIRTVFEDRRGNLWVGTNAGGLDRLDRARWTFEHHRPDPARYDSLSDASVFAVIEDRDGRLWVGTQGGLNRLDPATGRFERFPAGPDGPGSDYVAGLHLDGEGGLWIATVGGGLARRDPGTGKFTVFRHDPADSRSIASDRVFAIAGDDGGRLWVATDAGPCRMDPERGAFERFTVPPSSGGPPDLATDVVVDSEGAIWASTWNSGLWRFDPVAQRFYRHALRPRIPGNSVDRIVSLAVDRSNNVWAGTWGSGLARVSPRSQYLGVLPLASPLGTAETDVTAVLEDRAGRLWLGTGKNELWLRDGELPGRRVGSLPGTPLSLREDSQGEIWIGTTAGLCRFDARRGVSVERLGAGDLGSGVEPGWISALAVDAAGGLWIGTATGGVVRRSLDGACRWFTHDSAEPDTLSDDHVTSILVDRRGVVWVGTRSGGLSAFDAGTGRWSRYLPEAGDERSISLSNVSALLESSDGTLWVGTAGGGFDRVERNPGTGGVRFTRFSETDGLIDDTVVSMAEDSDGTVWVGTHDGLSRFDPRRRAFVSYGVDDGLPSVEMHPGTAWAGRSRLYFGTHRGTVVVPRGTPFLVPGPVPTVVTSLRTPAGPLGGDRPAWETSFVEIPFRQFLSVEFAALDFGDTRRQRYAYRLEPNGSDWIDLGARRNITFTGLEPGTFRLRVRGRSDQGVWSESAMPLTIRVVPPFWMTLGFRLVCAGALLAVAVSAHVVRTSALERRHRGLLELQRQRERALDQARKSQRELEEAYRRLRALTGRLEAAKEEERKWIAREIHDELGTGLSTAKLVLELLPGSTSSEERDRRVGEATRLIDGMIGRVRALSLDLRPPLLDELGLVAAIRGYVETLKRRASFQIRLETPELSMLREDVRIAAYRIVQEALTNVVRHARASQVSVELRYDPGWLEIRVVDDGGGFDVDEALRRAGNGEHAGLAGMMERVESMGGSVTIVSRPERGTEIWAQLPARN